MVRIVTDSSALYTREEARELGFDTAPLCLHIDDWEGKDLEMDYDRFYAKIKEGHNPKSSQPAIGDVVELYEKYPNDEIINITIADGLSGTYDSACSAKEMVENKERITVINSTTLCGPHRYLVDTALKMASEGKDRAEIVNWLKETCASATSFLLPQDFSFLRRGGRLTPVAATISSFLKLKPILITTPDGKRLDKFGVKRTLRSAATSIIKYLEEIPIDEKYAFYIAHANVPEDADFVKNVISKAFPKIEIQMFKLSHAFITQGGPGCIAIQYMKR
ncbi:MAG: DegV family protein [Eubacteriales bacterium]